MTQTPPPGDQPKSMYESTAQRNVLLFVLLVGAFVLILNQTLLNTALPHLMDYFDITAGEAQWVTTLFMLVNGIMIPVTAFLIGKFSTRQLFIGAMILFSVGTLVAALAPAYWILLLGRVLQAAAGGIIMPLMQTILFAIFPRNKRGSAMGVFGLIIGFAPAIGPSLSGWIVDHYPWHALFWLMLPFSLVSATIAAVLLKNVTERTDPTLDVLSVVLSTLGFGGLLFGFSMVGTAGWTAPATLVSLAVGLVALVWFIRRQLRLDEPMLQLRVLRNRQFTLNTVLGALVFIAMIGGMIILPVVMQTMLGFSALESGLALLPGALIMGLISPITGRLFDRFGGRWLVVVGFALITGTGAAFANLSTGTTFTYIAVVNALRMIGTSMVMMPATTAALNQLPPRMIPHGTAVNNTIRQVAASVGTAVLVSVMTMSAGPGLEGGIQGANTAFWVATAVAALGFVGGFFIRNSHGEETEGNVKTKVEPPRTETPNAAVITESSVEAPTDATTARALDPLAPEDVEKLK
ncbi:MDR family MFS transporter [Corynebacterium guangdongense]|uniref:EmrB/QacA subfamily drug resistance transporter n=1 Tax=Corynebacterium guangdongense TaxID=1783348 RepID=A0ABU2A080_9CORY|nr:MDR family MFS transporter [Corynebacterium guangdongense]MDR7329907.1 EmrB/QacA subfamily drug resistance transporter [Corynebacterium guangdongense]WJZ18465.1 Multidrug export protein EmrB [Corynebacterium guangdongense]